MARQRVLPAGMAILLAAGSLPAQQLPVADPVCTFFGPDHDQFVQALRHSRAALTVEVARQLPAPQAVAASASMSTAPGGSRTGSATRENENTIDKYIFQALTAANIAPAPPTTDF